MGRQFILKSNTATPIECLRYAPSLPTSALLAKTASAAEKGKYELFKTSDYFDATAKPPDWLG